MTEVTDVILPSNPKDRQKLRGMLGEVENCLIRMDSEREAKNEIVEEASTQFSIPKKLINKLARTMHKHNYSEMVTEDEMFQLLYEGVLEENS